MTFLAEEHFESVNSIGQEPKILPFDNFDRKLS